MLEHTNSSLIEINYTYSGVNCEHVTLKLLIAEIEDIEHILVKCNDVGTVWRKIWSWWSLPTPIIYPSLSIAEVALETIMSMAVLRSSKLLMGYSK